MTMIRLFALTAAFSVAFFATSASRAAIITFDAFLSGPAESPPNASPGTGTAEVDFNTTANTMRVRVNFSGLVGTTTASHIHSPTPVAGAGTAGVATTTPSFAGFPLGVKAGTYDNTLDMTQASSYNPAFVTANGGTPASAEAALLSSLNAGTSYLNIHSTVFSGDEIRGFLNAVPEPSTWALMTVGALGIVVCRATRKGARCAL
jgi:hypothetical protein